MGGVWPWQVVWRAGPKKCVLGPCPSDVVAAVMEQGAGLVLEWIGIEHCALHWGVSRGDVGLVRDMLDQGASTDFEYTKDWPQELGEVAPPMSAPFKWDYGPLHKAAYLGDLAMVQLLLGRGIGVNTQDQFGRTALDAAIDGWHEAVVAVLLEKGADVNLPNHHGHTAFHGALKVGSDVMVRLLIENGADINAVGNNGETALHMAAENEHEAMLVLLLRQGTEVTTKDKSGNTALHVAAGRGQAGCISTLLRFGADPKIKNNKEEVSLQMVEGMGFENEAQLKYLLDQCDASSHEAELV